MNASDWSWLPRLSGWRVTVTRIARIVIAGIIIAHFRISLVYAAVQAIRHAVRHHDTSVCQCLLADLSMLKIELVCL